MIEFFMAMIPPTTTHQQKRATICADGKVRFYEDEKLKAARQKLTANLWKYKPKRMANGPVRLYVKWCFPIKGKRKDGEYKTTKPDTDNLNKLLKDCMTDVGFWKDDALVASEIIEKFWADIPGIYVRVEEI
ncbi:MAG: RusA family crossover junction endodeoxyribonuclease [Tissierellia bacterium]|nr:RusA family crossover junction endodeoxyribonuclease [Tissierellia bacterium]